MDSGDEVKWFVKKACRSAIAPEFAMAAAVAAAVAAVGATVVLSGALVLLVVVGSML